MGTSPNPVRPSVAECPSQPSGGLANRSFAMPRLVPILVLFPALGAVGARVRVIEDASRGIKSWGAAHGDSRAWIQEPSAALGTDGFTVHLLRSEEAMQSLSSVKVRQLYKKTFKCRTANPSSCEECSGGPDCFGVRFNSGGSEYLYIQSNSSRKRNRYRHHRIRVNLHCPESAEFNVTADVTVSGWLNSAGMCVDGIQARTGRQDFMRKTRSMLLTKTWRALDSRIVEVDLHFRLRRKGWVRVNDIVVKMSSTYLSCQDRTACLRVLEGSGEGLALRQSNLMQLQCIEGLLPGSDACDEWKSCLDAAGSTERIRTLLLAAGVSTGGYTFMLARARGSDGGAGREASLEEAVEEEEGLEVLLHLHPQGLQPHLGPLPKGLAARPRRRRTAPLRRTPRFPWAPSASGARPSTSPRRWSLSASRRSTTWPRSSPPGLRRLAAMPMLGS
uniref:Uncharacterized protein n=1 Tax=Alexandrium monilatum TaxID=311494 RepID=A0A6T0UDQ2_9DINO